MLIDLKHIGIDHIISSVSSISIASLLETWLGWQDIDKTH